MKVISIRRDQRLWLEKQYALNFSGFVQEKLDELIKERKDSTGAIKKYKDTKVPLHIDI